ncbi:PREDICTED: uncharacterized protein LOC107346401 [Acropora digitifera]|uniref:uncharacterized protein LOC107346401 n=1 Tax=Acropora digitifera TaxID=70779 RepID=UPI00077A1A6C|nr:PREDICTED: uncharacterized protein LOC107346401 [Acropora digitifera]
MQSVQAYAVFVVCCVLHCTTGQNPGTRFTQAPPSTVSGILGYDVTFHWTFSFAVVKDWNDFEQIFWGMTDNDKRVTDKYMTVLKDGTAKVNYQLQPSSLQSRLGVTKNISKDRCILDFVLKNVTRRDATLKYGCTAIVYGIHIWNGPINLVLRGKQLGITANLVIPGEVPARPEGIEMLIMLIILYSKVKSREEGPGATRKVTATCRKHGVPGWSPS